MLCDDPIELEDFYGIFEISAATTFWLRFQGAFPFQKDTPIKVTQESRLFLMRFMVHVLIIDVLDIDLERHQVSVTVLGVGFRAKGIFFWNGVRESQRDGMMQKPMFQSPQ